MTTKKQLTSTTRSHTPIMKRKYEYNKKLKGSSKRPRLNSNLASRPSPYNQASYLIARSIKKGVDSYFASGATAPDFNTTNIVTDMSNNSFIFPVNLIQAGAGSWQRIGRVVNMKSIRVNGWFTLSYDNAQNDNWYSRAVRMLIIYDKQPNGTLPIKSDIIGYKNQAGTEAGNYTALLNYDNMQRFTVIRDMQMPLTWTAVTPTDNTSEAATVTMKCHVDQYAKIGLETTYKAESNPAVIGDISTGALYVIFMTDYSTDTLNPNLYFTGVSRLRYTDQ